MIKNQAAAGGILTGDSAVRISLVAASAAELILFAPSPRRRTVAVYTIITFRGILSGSGFTIDIDFAGRPM